VLNGAGAVYSKREERAPFCAFGDDGINCNPYDFAANANKWPDGTPIANGQYTLVVVTRATSGASKREELPFAIQLAPDAPAPAPVPPAPVRAVDCSRSSLPSDNPTTITFINQSGRIVQVFWVDFSGQEQAYSTLALNEQVRQSTFVNHSWCVRDRDTGTAVLFVIATINPQDAIIP
jgi:hypothetical protein